MLLLTFRFHMNFSFISEMKHSLKAVQVLIEHFHLPGKLNTSKLLSPTARKQGHKKVERIYK